MQNRPPLRRFRVVLGLPTLTRYVRARDPEEARNLAAMLVRFYARPHRAPAGEQPTRGVLPGQELPVDP